MASTGSERQALPTLNGFAPVAGERFDLVVANPPFVISPDSSFVFRDSRA
jgi:methylase of polypeptide subunit release factors